MLSISKKTIFKRCNSAQCFLRARLKHLHKALAPSLGLQLGQFLFCWSRFPLSGTCQPQCPGPLARHLADGQLGEENPQPAGLHRFPLHWPDPYKLHLLFFRTKATHEQWWHVDKTREIEQAAVWTSQPHFPGCSVVVGHSSRVKPERSIYWSLN